MQVLEANPQSIADFKAGKDRALGFLVGQAMKATKGQANPQMLNKMFLEQLNKYQRFNHFPMTWQLSRKDNLYRNYFKLHTKFPNDFKYMPETYVLPKDQEIVNEKLKDFNLNDKTNLWLIKPVASSRGRGIRLLTDLESLPKKNIITHYIYNPFLINGKKFDLRLYFGTPYFSLNEFIKSNK